MGRACGGVRGRKGRGLSCRQLQRRGGFGVARRKGCKGVLGVKMGNVRIFGLKRGVRVSSFKEK